jgi:hypothetical protein
LITAFAVKRAFTKSLIWQDISTSARRINADSGFAGRHLLQQFSGGSDTPERGDLELCFGCRFDSVAVREALLTPNPRKRFSQVGLSAWRITERTVKDRFHMASSPPTAGYASSIPTGTTRLINIAAMDGAHYR